MALEVTSSKRKQPVSEQLDLELLKQILETHPQYSQQNWDVKSTLQFLTKPKEVAVQRPSKRRQCLNRLMERLAVTDIPGKDLVEEYFRDQYLRKCSFNTLRNCFTPIVSFLAFIKELKKADLSAVTHKDMLAYIEREQDRGMCAQTVHIRVRILRTFFRYLLERDFINSEVIAKRIVIKVPEALPRAMDPEDVKELLGYSTPFGTVQWY